MSNTSLFDSSVAEIMRKKSASLSNKMKAYYERMHYFKANSMEAKVYNKIP